MQSLSMKATEQYFPVVLFIMLYVVVLTFNSVDENCYAVRFQVKVGKCLPILNLRRLGKCMGLAILRVTHGR